MPTSLGVTFGREFFWGPEALKTKVEKLAEKYRYQNSLRNSLEIFLNFAGPT